MTMDAKPARLKSAATYDAAADSFDAPPLGFWERHGRRAVELAQLSPADRVLDVGCGTGASALPAAEAVGPEGSVLGIDVSENMLSRARAKAAARGLRNVAFRNADMTASGEPDAAFDAVIGVFSVFFVPDVEGLLTELWRMVRPGGRLVATFWGENAFQPVAEIVGAELRRLDPERPPLVRPWERFTGPEAVRRLFAAAGAAEPALHAVADRQPLREPADGWTVVMGSGYRWEVEQLRPVDRQVLRDGLLRRLTVAGAAALETSALHAVARLRTRPPGGSPMSGHQSGGGSISSAQPSPPTTSAHADTTQTDRLSL